MRDRGRGGGVPTVVLPIVPTVVLLVVPATVLLVVPAIVRSTHASHVGLDTPLYPLPTHATYATAHAGAHHVKHLTFHPPPSILNTPLHPPPTRFEAGNPSRTFELATVASSSNTSIVLLAVTAIVIPSTTYRLQLLPYYLLVVTAAVLQLACVAFEPGAEGGCSEVRRRSAV